MLVDDAIRSVAQHCPSVDRILTMDTERLYSFIRDKDDIAVQYGKLKEKCAFLCELSFDMIVNVNFSQFTTVLSTMPKSTRVCGYSICPEQRQLKKDPWFIFLNSIVKNSPLAPFNLVDYFYYIHGTVSTHPKSLSFFLESSEIDSAFKMLSRENISDRNILIAFQLGARHEQRQWPVSYFSELARNLLQQENAHIILLGTEDDMQRGDEFKQHISSFSQSYMQRVHDFINKTGISELAGLLKQSDLLISCDTGTMHLATAVGCQVLALFFGPAFVYHTGPYGPGHWVIQAKSECSPCIEDEAPCNDYHCKQAIKPDTVFSLAKHIISEDRGDIDLYLTNDIEVFKSRLDTWGIVYDSLYKRQATVTDIQNVCYREMGKKLIDRDYELTNSEIESSLFKYTFDNNSILKSKIEQILKQAQRLIHECYSAPHEISRAKLDKSMSFWHPWIDYYREVQRFDPDSMAKHAFVSGMHTGAKVLEGIIENYN